MVVHTSIGPFEVEPHPESPQAVIVRGALEALRVEVLPDLEIEGGRAVVAKDEWCHAVDALGV